MQSCVIGIYYTDIYTADKKEDLKKTLENVCKRANSYQFNMSFVCLKHINIYEKHVCHQYNTSFLTHAAVSVFKKHCLFYLTDRCNAPPFLSKIYP